MALINKHWPVISKHHTPREMEFTVLLTLIKNILSKWVFFNVGGGGLPSIILIDLCGEQGFTACLPGGQHNHCPGCWYVVVF